MKICKIDCLARSKVIESKNANRIRFAQLLLLMPQKHGCGGGAALAQLHNHNDDDHRSNP